MNWNLEEAIAYYKSQGAPADQTALVSLLKEVQLHHDGAIPTHIIPIIANACGVKENYLLAIIRRIPSLRSGDSHLLEICSGPHCSKHTALATFAEQLQRENLRVKSLPCMRMCGKGPNIRWDGQLYHKADEALLRKLAETE